MVAKDELQWNVRKDLKDFVWYLPEPGEWFSPMSLEEMGIAKPLRPALPEGVLRENAKNSVVQTAEGISAGVEEVILLWRLLVSYVQSPEGSELRSGARRQIRSLGWSLYFGTRAALAGYTRVIDVLARGPLDLPKDRLDRKDLEDYANMGLLLARIWNKTGDFVIVV